MIGTEIAAGAVDAGQAMGLDIRGGELDELALPDSGFDVVSMIEVVEHVPDPNALLASARRLLRPGGMLYLTTPNGRGISARVLGVRWSVLSPPEHLQLFSIRGLRIVLERAGLVVRKVQAHGVNPGELLRGLRAGDGRVIPGGRVDTSYRLNESLSASRAGAAFKAAANAALNASRLGDSLKVLAERPV
jgi:SAM-dependent methyltransferase